MSKADKLHEEYKADIAHMAYYMEEARKIAAKHGMHNITESLTDMMDVAYESLGRSEMWRTRAGESRRRNFVECLIAAQGEYT